MVQMNLISKVFKYATQTNSKYILSCVLKIVYKAFQYVYTTFIS